VQSRLMANNGEEGLDPPRVNVERRVGLLLLALAAAGATWAAAGDDPPRALVEGQVTALLAWVLLALSVSFLCSVSEATLLSVTPTFIEALAVRHPQRAALLRRVRQEQLGRSLAGILTLNTIANTAGAVGAGAEAADVFGSLWVGVFSAAFTLTVLFLSEIVPKTLGAVYWSSLAVPMAVVVRGVVVGLYPLILVTEGLTRTLSRGAAEHAFTREEFLALAGMGERAGLLNEQESRIIRNLFRFGSLKAKDIMTPRPVIQALPDHLTVAEAVARHGQTPFTRLLLYRGEIDQVCGFVIKDEILLAHAQGRGDVPVATLARELKSVSGGMSLSRLLEFLLRERVHIVVVVGEYGELKGLVTLEDVVETLLGMEIVDEVDTVEDLQALARQRWAARARALGLHLEEEAPGHGVSGRRVSAVAASGGYGSPEQRQGARATAGGEQSSEGGEADR